MLIGDLGYSRVPQWAQKASASPTGVLQLGQALGAGGATWVPQWTQKREPCAMGLPQWAQ